MDEVLKDKRPNKIVAGPVRRIAVSCLLVQTENRKEQEATKAVSLALS